MPVRRLRLAAPVLAASAIACAAPAEGDGLAAARRAALADAAQRTGLDAAALVVRTAERITWPDGSLGCAQPGVRYTMAPVAGYRIVVDAGGRVLDYRAGRRGVPVLCVRGGAGGGTDR